MANTNTNQELHNAELGGSLTDSIPAGSYNNAASGGEEKIQKTSRRGFAAMNPERQREIAQSGGRVAHQRGVAHKWTSEEAKLAGRKGGQSSRSKTNGTNNTQPV